MHKLIFLLSVLFIYSCFTKDNIRVGDLLFQDLDCGKICDAIEKVTEGIDGAKLSHVALVSKKENAKFYVIEAFTDGVIEIPLEKFLNRNKDSQGRPKVIVGRFKRLKNDYKEYLKLARTFIGKPYDDVFKINNEKYYCSELIYEIFKKENAFKLKAMTFKDPKTLKIMATWLDYFKKLGLKVPEGKKGINPGLISRSKYIKIVHAFGCPSGWKKCDIQEE